MNQLVMDFFIVSSPFMQINNNIKAPIPIPFHKMQKRCKLGWWLWVA